MQIRFINKLSHATNQVLDAIEHLVSHINT